MVTQRQIETQAIRHRVLEGLLARLARSTCRDTFVLRGGMLLRAWFPQHNRPAGDLDLVATTEFDIDRMTGLLVPLLANRHMYDGVVFDTKRYRVRGIWLNTSFPGVRFWARGRYAGQWIEVSTDVTFGEPLVPKPIRMDYPFQFCQAAELTVCRPETIIGRKLHALWHMGELHWRPKDLYDLRHLLLETPNAPEELKMSIQASFASRGDSPDLAFQMLAADSWRTSQLATARWFDFLATRMDQSAIEQNSLATVVAEVFQNLKPILEDLL